MNASIHHAVRVFYTAKCDYPFNEYELHGSVRVLITSYYRSRPMLEGSIITVSCPSGYSLTGSNASTCMGNGEWEPDPRKAECTGINQ